MKKLLLPVLICIGFTGFAQDNDQTIETDTLRFKNNNVPGYVVQTTIKHFYNDSTCVWEISFPEVFGLKDDNAAYDINKTFEMSVAIGDCQLEDECTYYTTIPFPEYHKYWNRVRVTGLQQDLLCYYYQEGGCTYDEPFCYDNVTYVLHDLKTGREVDGTTIFKTDETSQHKLRSLIVSKLGFTPHYIEALDFARQVGFDNDGIIIYYGEFTLAEKDSYALRFTFDELKSVLNPKGRISALRAAKK